MSGTNCDYLKELWQYTTDNGVSLYDGFIAGGVSKSTFYRTIAGQTSIRKETALAVIKGIDKLAARQRKRK